MYVRAPLEFSPDVTERMPKRSCAVSDVEPPTVAVRSRSFSVCAPIPAGHHRFGLSMPTGGNDTVLVWFAVSDTDWLTARPATAPLTVVVTAAPVVFRTSALTTRSAC